MEKSQKWQTITYNIRGLKMYGVYKLIDKQQINYASNRELSGGYITKKEIAIALAKKLNQKNN